MLIDVVWNVEAGRVPEDDADGFMGLGISLRSSPSSERMIMGFSSGFEGELRHRACRGFSPSESDPRLLGLVGRGRFWSVRLGTESG
jgi:hypothetical protein